MNFVLKIFMWIFIILSPFIISLIVHFLYFYFVKNMRFKEGEYHYITHGSKLRRILIDLPRQIILDRFNNVPDEFKEYGVHIVAGKQGTGKSITLTYLLMRYQEMYPKLKVATNYYYKHEDKHISHWKDIINYNNGPYGVIVVLDEIQNWFNSLQSKDFPPEMLTEITQQRKQRKVIFGTSQVFGRVAKPIREQTYMLYEPVTLFGCLTFVRKYDITTDISGNTDSKKYRGCFFFVQNEEIRSAFNTYLKVENLANEGFKSEEQQLHNSNMSIDIKEKTSLFHKNR